MLRKTVVARALSIAFSTAALSAAVVLPAAAQSNAAGTVYGKVASGAATSVVLRNLDTNQQRTSQLDATGAFAVSSLPIGRYSVTLEGGTMSGKTTQVDVLAGQGVEAVFATGQVARVEVTGHRSRIDVSNAVNGATFTARELAKLPVARNVSSIIQLAPNTTKSDPTYVAGASIGGGATSENAYYINGAPVTNPLTQLGASELPFGAIAQAEIKTGGYGAEFGRSVGGVVNIVGKSGTNRWEFGALASTTPDRLRSAQKDIYFNENGGAYANKVRFRQEDNQYTNTQVGAFVGGPIVQDKVFMFASVENTKHESHVVNLGQNSSAGSLASSGWRDRMVKTLRYYGDLAWNITDNHRIEFTQIGDLPSVDTQYRSYDYASRAVGSKVMSTMHEETPGTSAAANGAEVQILRYTGNLTDDLTLTALASHNKTVHVTEPGGYDPKMPGVSATADNRAPGLNYNSPQSFIGTQNASGSTDDVDFQRMDIEYKLGTHTLRAGADNMKLSSLNSGKETAGGFTWVYQKSANPGAPTPVPGGVVPAFAGNGPLASQGYYVYKNIYRTASDAYSKQYAQYIEDNWKVTKNLLLTIGVRNESFENQNSAHVAYLSEKNIVQPRAQIVWDVNGDSSLKVYGSAGRYSVQMPTSVALRGANGSLNTSQYYTYSGTDANGNPTGLTQLTPPLSANGEFGQPKDPRTVAAIDMKPSTQDELTVGFDQAYSPSLTWGAKATYRKLRSTIDDFCDGRPFRRYALQHNITMAGEADWDPESPSYPYFQCASFNPGEAQDFWIDYAQNGQYTKVHLTAAEIGFQKPERVYKALDVYFEHPYRNGWYGKINYTWSRNTGNTEGQTLSDLNTGQGDVAATTTWDYSEIMRYANGLLPNDRTHQIKAFGFWDFMPEWTLGGNIDIESGRPRGCLGWDPNPISAADWEQVGPSPNYGVEHFCFGKTWEQNVPAPRGTMGRYAWTKSLDLNLAYKPKMLDGLKLQVDVFNVFNNQEVVKRNEQYNNGAGNISIYYNTVGAYSSPRSVRLSAEFNKKF